MTIQHDTATQEFTATRDGHPATLVYTRPAPGVVDFTHTFVDEALRGQGLADELARVGLAYARAQQLRVKTTCSFMAGFVRKHRADYADLLA